jgi:[protein-PII] uridylyltransferase
MRNTAAEAVAASGPSPAIRAEEAALIARLIDTAPLPRDEALGMLRRELGAVQARVQQAFESRETHGLGAARRLSGHMDAIILAIHAYAEAMIPRSPGGREEAFALVATGGYGRGVLAPYSDIDLLFLTGTQVGARTERLVEFMLYLLWDLGLKVGHATRSVKDCLAHARRDATIQTALVDSRFMAGNERAFNKFSAEFGKMRATDGLGPFLAAKRAERATRPGGQAGASPAARAG